MAKKIRCKVFLCTRYKMIDFGVFESYKAAKEYTQDNEGIFKIIKLK